MRKSQVNSYKVSWVHNAQSAINYLNILFANEPELVQQFYLDNRYEDYVDAQGIRLYNDKEARHRNILAYHVLQGLDRDGKLSDGTSIYMDILKQYGRQFTTKTKTVKVWTRIGTYVSVPLLDNQEDGKYDRFEKAWESQLELLAQKINNIDGIQVSGDTYAPGDPSWLDENGKDYSPEWRPQYPEMNTEIYL